MAEHDDFDALVFRWQWIAPEAHKMTEWEGMCLRYMTCISVRYNNLKRTGQLPKFRVDFVFGTV